MYCTIPYHNDTLFRHKSAVCLQSFTHLEELLARVCSLDVPFPLHAASKMPRTLNVSKLVHRSTFCSVHGFYSATSILPNFMTQGKGYGMQRSIAEISSAGPRWVSGSLGIV